jgi:hypothetical protein
MSFNDLEKTRAIVLGDYFLLMMDQEPVASAIVFEVAPTIAQVILLGRSFRLFFKTPNEFIAFELFHLYKKRGFAFLDIGPSSEEGVPNTGLCSLRKYWLLSDLKYHFTLLGKA